MVIFHLTRSDLKRSLYHVCTDIGKFRAWLLGHAVSSISSLFLRTASRLCSLFITPNFGEWFLISYLEGTRYLHYTIRYARHSTPVTNALYKDLSLAVVAMPLTDLE